MLHRTQKTIKQYALAISNELDNLTRAKIHLDLCEALHLDYKKFKPFESSDIKSVPTFKEAERLLWYALRDAIYDNILEYKRKIGLVK